MNNNDNRPRPAAVICLTTILLLSACGGQSPVNTSANEVNVSNPDAVDTSPRNLCASNACGSKTALLTIPSAENILFTPTGRLFVSGGTNVFEIVDNNDTLEAVPLFDGSGNFAGLGLRGNTLYVNTLSGELYAATVNADPQLVKIYDYVNASMPNGMAVDSDGNLYTVDGPITTFPPAPQVLRLRFNPTNPMEVIEQTVWLNSSLQFSNGLTYNGESFFITDSNGAGEPGSVRRIDINDDGSAGTVTTLYTGAGILDDLSVVGDKLLVSGFQNGDIILIDQNGNVEQQTTPGTFSSASAVQAGEPPLFSRDDILVTEKGLLNDNDSAIGNVLSVFRAN